MKQLLTLALGIGVACQVSAQDLRQTSKQVQDAPINLSASPKGPKKVSNLKRSAAINLNPVKLSISGNPNSQASNAPVRVAVNNDLNAVVFAHRGALAGNGPATANSGYFDVSIDGGTTWDLNKLVIQNQYTAAGWGYRYPQGAIMNPAGNTDIANARLVSMMPVSTGAGWGPGAQGSMKFDGTARVQQYYRSGKIFIPESMRAGAPGTVWATNDSSAIEIWKGTYDAANDSMVWSINYTIDHSLFTLISATTNTFVYNTSVAFDPTGMNGWICATGDLVADGLDSLTYPVLWKTTDGGNNWTGPISVKLETVPEVATNPIFTFFDEDTQADTTFKPTTAFEDALSVDANGNPHFFASVYPDLASTAYSVPSSLTQGLFDITTADGGATWKGILVDTITGLRGTIIGAGATGITQDNRAQISQSPDGTQLFFSWAATTPANQIDPAAPTNASPDYFVRGLNVNSGTMTPVYNVTGGSNFDAGAFLSSAGLKTTKTGSVNSIHAIIVEPTGNESSPVNNYYLDGIDIDDADFVTGIAKAEKNNLFSVSANYPNPFSKTTTFNISLTQAADVTVSVSNILGQTVNEFSETKAAGTHPVQINAAGLSSGIYFYTVSAGGYKVTNKMIVK